MPAMRVAVFGGSFNPPHVSHVLAVTYVLSVAEVERVVVVPVFAHPFVKELASYDERVAMCELAMGWIPAVEISRIEQSLEPPSLTLRTLEGLEAAHPEWSMRLVVGADVLDDSHNWHAWESVVSKAPPILLGRAGVARPDVPSPVLPEISSTRIRELLSVRDSASRDELARLVPRAVLAHIFDHDLYP